MLVESTAVIIAREGISQNSSSGSFSAHFPASLPIRSDTLRESPEQRCRGSPAAEGGDTRSPLSRSAGPAGSAVRQGGDRGLRSPYIPPGSAARLVPIAESGGEGESKRMKLAKLSSAT